MDIYIMKKYFIYNTVYLPINMPSPYDGEQKYVGASINGTIFLNDIYSESELLKKYKDNPDFKECTSLHDICKKWGND